MMIRTNDGKVFCGRTAREVVRKMRRAAHFPEQHWKPYMKAVASRATLWNGARVSTYSSHLFLMDLETAGFIERLPEPVQLRLV